MKEPPELPLFRMIQGKSIAQALSVAATLSVADALKDGPLSPAEAAAAVGAHGPTLRRLLRALASLGVFEEDAEGRFALTELGQFLRDDHPRSVRPLSMMQSLDEFWRPWGALLHSVQTGEPAFGHVFGKTFFDHLQDHPEPARIFDRAMTSVSEGDNRMVLASYDFSGFRTIADVGGGSGRLLCAILEACPQAKGLLCDLGHVLEGATELIASRGLTERIELRPMSFFDGVPEGADAYVLKHIIHDWGDDDCVKILRHCRSAAPPEGRVLVVESPLPPGNDPSPTKFLDLQMLVMTAGGRERYPDEYRELFQAAGLDLVEIHRSPGRTAVLEGKPA